MSSVFVLCANHNSKSRAGQALLREIAGRIGKPFRACHVGCFHDDTPSWNQVTVDFLTRLGARCEAPRLSDPALDIARAREALEGADLLYLDGGDTVAGVEHIRARGLLDAVRESAARARFVFGLSGGACAAGPYTIGYRDDGAAYVAPCLDLGPPLPLDVHDEEHDWPEMRALLELRPPQRAGLVIPTGGVLRVEQQGRELASLALPLVERRELADDGGWRVEPLAAREHV
jgi:hypothetical protein